VLDGKDGVNETFRRDGPSLPSGRAVTVLCSVRNDGVRATIDGAEALNWKGRLDRLSLPASLTGSLPARRLFLFSFDTHFSITELYVRSASAGGIPNPDPDARNVSARIKVDPARSIVLDSAISRWLLDENNQILALQPASNSLLQISIPDRKVVRKVPTGNGPTALCAVPGSPKQVWVAVQGGQSLVRIDLEKGAIVETVPVAYVPAFILAVRKYLWCLDSSWVLHGIDVSDRKDLGTLGTGGISEVAYDSKKDRLWVLGKQAILDYDASRIGMILRELSRKNLTGGERAELQQEMNKATKSYAVSGPLTRPVGYGLLLDDRNGKVYFNRNAAKIERPDLILGAFRPPAHSMGSEPAVRDLLSLSSPFLNEILAASADGKWVASGTHVFSATTLLVQKEVPLPSPLVGFSKDSKTLYYFDWANRVIAALDVEAK
jgi:hypothetical protein